jgi:hypothetical protein
LFLSLFHDSNECIRQNKKETIVVYVRMLTQGLLGGTEKNRETIKEDSLLHGREFNARPPEYKAWALTHSTARLGAYESSEAFLMLHFFRGRELVMPTHF